MKTPCLWWKEHINLLNLTPPASQLGTPPPPTSDQGTPPPAPAHVGGRTLPPFPPVPSRPSSPPPPSPPRKRWWNIDAAAPAAPARRSTPPPSPPRKQQRKTAAAAPAAPASSSTARGGRQYRFGPSLKPLERLPYEMTEEENMKIYKAQVKDFFEMQRAKKHPPPEEKIDPVKAKRTLDALKRPPPSLPQTNYERIIERSYKEASLSRSTCSDRRLAERRSGKKFPSSANKRTNRAPA